MNDPRRLLNFPSLLNARDLGGYPTRDASHTRWGSLVRADDLTQLTPAGVQALSAFGVETVVDLRWPEETAVSPSPVPRELNHVTYIHIPLLAQSASQWQTLSTPGPKEMWKCTVLEQTRSELRQVLGAIADSSSGPLVFHCVAGKDRTGLIAALMLTLADVVPDAIAYDYAASADCLREAYLQRYPESDPEEVREAVRCPEEGVHNMLEYLAQCGGIRAYLEGIGLAREEIARLRARLRS
jgi:protein-tyrosine phosphatase